MKHWYESKTIWFNIITGILALFAFPQFISILPASAEPWIALFNAGGNYILRSYYTTTGIAPTPPTE